MKLPKRYLMQVDWPLTLTLFYLTLLAVSISYSFSLSHLSSSLAFLSLSLFALVFLILLLPLSLCWSLLSHSVLVSYRLHSFLSPATTFDVLMASDDTSATFQWPMTIRKKGNRRMSNTNGGKKIEKKKRKMEKK